LFRGVYVKISPSQLYKRIKGATSLIVALGKINETQPNILTK